MIFVGTADIHLSMYSQDKIIKGLPERLYYLKEVLNNMALYAITNNISNMVIAGDTFHTKSIIHSLAQSVLLDFIRDYNEKITFYITNGNHDMSSKSGEGVSALKCLDNEDNVVMIHKPTIIENIHFVPWDPRTMITTIKNGGASYLVSHFGVNEATLNSGISIISEIKMSDIQHYKRCFLGHYHKPQELGNVFIFGSPIQLDWGEKGEEKRFLVVDTDKDTVESVKIEGYKKHIEINLETTDSEELMKIYSEAYVLKEQGHDIKFNLCVSGIDDSDIKNEFRVIDRVEKDITNRGINTAMSADDILNRYLEIHEIPDEKRDIYLNVGKEIIDSIT